VPRPLVADTSVAHLAGPSAASSSQVRRPSPLAVDAHALDTHGDLYEQLNDDPGPRDACGVFGAFARGEEVAKLAYYGLYALQHRGQEAAGIAVSDGKSIVVYKELGLVSQVFDEVTLGSLSGYIAVGHTRYSTTGACTWENAQPSYRSHERGGIALGHNGNLTNIAEVAELLAAQGGRRGAVLTATTDS
jgi:amidophosphoribosyltransferase